MSHIYITIDLLYNCIAACPIKGQIKVECAPHPSCQLACNSTGNEVCPLSCQINGCVCPNGTVIDWEKNQCVTPNECRGKHCCY